MTMRWNLRAMVGVAVQQLRHHRRRATLAVAGVALAVVLVVVLAGLGHGLLTTGGEAIGWIDHDLWVSGGSVSVAPGALGGVENPIRNAHEVGRDIEGHPGVRHARPFAFQSVYVSRNGSGFGTVVGVGVGSGPAGAPNDSRFEIPDSHYANGSYDGEMVHEAVISPALADRYDVGVGDTLHVGGTLELARANEFRVVDVDRSFRTFLGAPAVAVPLSELQTVTGTTGTDPASLIAVTVEPDAEPASVARDIEATDSTLTVRTNREQVRAIVGGRGEFVAAALALVVLAVLGGIALVVNVLATWVYHQRRELAALKAAGLSGRTLGGIVLAEGLLVGVVGGLLGLAAVPPAVRVLNGVARHLSGFPGLIQTPTWLLVGALALALAMGVVGAMLAVWRVSRLSSLAHLDG